MGRATDWKRAMDREVWCSWRASSVVSRRSLRRPTLAMIRDAAEGSALQARNSFAPALFCRFENVTLDSPSELIYHYFGRD